MKEFESNWQHMPGSKMSHVPETLSFLTAHKHSIIWVTSYAR